MKKFHIRFENIHIFLWLLKDLSWLMGFKILGVLVMIPTIVFAGLIVWKSRKSKLDLFPNLAVLFWIIANSWWMTVEFFVIDDRFRLYALMPFALGLIMISNSFILSYSARE